MSEDQTITYHLTVDTSQVAANVGEVNRLLTTYIALARQAELPANPIDAIARLQQLRIALETTYRAYILFTTATGPVGWLLAIGTGALGAFMLTDQMAIRRPRY
jgi:hypothetical protein